VEKKRSQIDAVAGVFGGISAVERIVSTAARAG
jgi:hypothetical protein